MRSVTIFLFESNWERDFSCLSINSSTFSRQDGAMSLVEDNMIPSRNSNGASVHHHRHNTSSTDQP